MKLPLITKSTRPIYPRNGKCPVCSTKIGEPNSFLCVNGGAMMQIEENVLGMDNNIFGFLDIHFHGAHDNGIGEHKDKSAFRQIVSNSTGGQFDLYFCSTKCFRSFISGIIDGIENELKN